MYCVSIGGTFSPVSDLVERLEVFPLDFGRLKADAKFSCDRAGRFNARAALCSNGEMVEEKLYGTELWSSGCTWEVWIFTFSSKKSFLHSANLRITGTDLEKAGWWNQVSRNPMEGKSVPANARLKERKKRHEFLHDTLRNILIDAPSCPRLAFPSIATRVTTFNFCGPPPEVTVGE